ncbi:MAG TPA: glycosyl hydrolase [Candidatus Norongarragalinales archaeon]|nr:glycosyl hydrolase [Candidatus Norongarragalinales archaeon]
MNDKPSTLLQSKIQWNLFGTALLFVLLFSSATRAADGSEPLKKLNSDRPILAESTITLNVGQEVTHARIPGKIRVISVQSTGAHVSIGSKTLMLKPGQWHVTGQTICLKLNRAYPVKKQIELQVLDPKRCPKPMRKAESPFQENRLRLGLFTYPEKNDFIESIFPKKIISAIDPKKLLQFENAYRSFELATRSSPSIYLNYIRFGNPFKKEWADYVVRRAIRKGKSPMIQIGFEPMEGCKKVKSDAYLRKFLADADKIGVPILLRFASEMNDPHIKYYTDPEDYKKCFNVVGKAVHQYTKNVYMVWAPLPNSPSRHYYEDFYPADGPEDYVDVIGLNAYFTPVLPYDLETDGPRYEESADYIFSITLDPMYKFAEGKGKDLMISEGGIATYYQNKKIKPPERRDWTAFALETISQLYSYPKTHPRLKAIVNFEADLPLIDPKETKSWSIVTDCRPGQPISNCKLANRYRDAISKYATADSNIKIS